MKAEAATGIVLLWLFVAMPVHAKAVGNRDALIEQAASLDQQNRLDEAIELLKEGIDTDPEFAQTYIKLGYLQLKKNDYSAALGLFEQAGDFKRAEVILRDALVLNPNPVRTHYELGVVYQKLGDSIKAIAEYKAGMKRFKQGRQ